MINPDYEILFSSKKKYIINSWKQKEESCVIFTNERSQLKKTAYVWFYLHNRGKTMKTVKKIDGFGGSGESGE